MASSSCSSSCKCLEALAQVELKLDLILEKVNQMHTEWSSTNDSQEINKKFLHSPGMTQLMDSIGSGKLNNILSPFLSQNQSSPPENQEQEQETSLPLEEGEDPTMETSQFTKEELENKLEQESASSSSSASSCPPSVPDLSSMFGSGGLEGNPMMQMAMQMFQDPKLMEQLVQSMCPNPPSSSAKPFTK